MDPRFGVGDQVQTPLGKGLILEVRHGGRLLVGIAGRKVVLEATAVRLLDPPAKAARKKRPAPAAVEDDGGVAGGRRPAPAEVDLHGLFVADALARVELAINDALLDGRLQLRIIHGRSGGRIKAAVHRQLDGLPPVRAFRLDPGNDGVTIVDF
jgi:dsDNA-specific endonuclease/ATPase MutS2